MPYVPSKKTNPPAEDREMLDAAVERVAEDIVLQAGNIHNFSLRHAYVDAFVEIGDVLRQLLGKFYDPKHVADTSYAKLAATIYGVADKYNYEGAHLGELNYAITRLIQRVPQIKVERGDWKQEDELRYWVYAVTVKALTVVVEHFNKENDYYCAAGVFEDVKDEYKRRVNTAYEAAQIVKSGDCYDAPYYTRLVPVFDEYGENVGHMEIMLKRSKETVAVDVLPYQLFVRKQQKY